MFYIEYSSFTSYNTECLHGKPHRNFFPKHDGILHMRIEKFLAL